MEALGAAWAAAARMRAAWEDSTVEGVDAVSCSCSHSPSAAAVCRRMLGACSEAGCAAPDSDAEDAASCSTPAYSCPRPSALSRGARLLPGACLIGCCGCWESSLEELRVGGRSPGLLPEAVAVVAWRDSIVLVSRAAGACSEAWCAAVAAASMDGFTGDAVVFVPARHNMHIFMLVTTHEGPVHTPDAIRMWCSRVNQGIITKEQENNVQIHFLKQLHESLRGRKAYVATARLT